ncbi:putative adhesin [Sediminihabitans luteus]|uniref:Putative adhesin n=1 Tax=Sediminihabitans luteus TaxID=1138585 RepID=A0A2M9CYS4_9CELL|nr:DUF4097 family beta strand repeat-containing protein [Sediminihabitans luteus]PJJ77092.1 putative adhesin [Sediminihabitans luteus]GIJ00389.1 hypothetical protein Slu03_27660 [Sediminihabitans luteus]
MPVFATPEPIVAVVDLAGGTLTVVASDRTDTEVTVTPSDPTRPGDVRAANEAVVELHDDTLTVRINRSWRTYSPFGSNRSADVTIALPSGSRLEGGSLGPLLATGRLGACTFTSRAGDVRVDEAHALDLRASAGAVVVGRATGPTSVVASAGQVRLREVTGDAVVKNTVGSTEVGESTGTLRVNGAHGAVTVTRSLGETTVRTAHSAIRVEEAAGGTLRLENSSGSIDVGIPEGTAAWVDATSDKGVVRNLLTEVPTPDAADRTVEVCARSGWGDVVVRRPHA